MPSYLHDLELSDETIGRAFSSPLFIQEREESAGRRQAYHSFEESLLPAQTLSVCHVRTVRPVHELSSLGLCSREKRSRDSEKGRVRILLDRQQEQILADFVELRFTNSISKPMLIEEVFRKCVYRYSAKIN